MKEWIKSIGICVVGAGALVLVLIGMGVVALTGLEERDDE